MRPGFYVNGRRYGFDRRAQAIARAEWLAAEFARDVRVEAITPTGQTCLEHVARFEPTSTSLMAVG
jgi:hypothetical protein